MYGVITTVNAPTKAAMQLNDKIKGHGKLCVVGDKRGPNEYNLNGVLFIHSDDVFDFNIFNKLPFNHYARKNLGYLIAMRDKASCIYETDDDNRPMSNWRIRDLNVCTVTLPVDKCGVWLNVYRYFTDVDIWPRGYPLEVSYNDEFDNNPEYMTQVVYAPIQQGLADGDPDVDAIWRLSARENYHVRFNKIINFQVPRNVWCPFNSQNTWWWPKAYPLMYLPSYCSFRMTDIWRGFIAQRCLWELGYNIVFHTSDVYQHRNIHDLNDDLALEQVGYTNNAKIVDLLMSLPLLPGQLHVHNNLRKCYRELVRHNILPIEELTLVDLWLKDVLKLGY